jgi:hypothetical protein
VRGHELLAAFPLSTAAEFTNRPFLVGSQPRHNVRVAQAVRSVHGPWEDGDQFVLMTDALAAWFLAAYEAGEQPMHVLEGFSMPDGAAEFAAWVAALRTAHQLRNDDTTLVRVIVAHDQKVSAA